MYTSLELNDIGAMLLSRGETSLAIEALTEALSLDPSNETILCNLANAYASYGELDLAIPLFEKALALNEDLFEANHSLGFAYRKKDPLKALKYLEKAVTLRDSDAALHFALANIYVDLEDYNKAVSYLEKLTKDFPDYAKFFSLLNYVYSEILEWEKQENNATLVNQFLQESLSNPELAVIEEPLMNIFRVDDPHLNYLVSVRKSEEIYAKNTK